MSRRTRRPHSPVLIFVAVLVAALLFALVQVGDRPESAEAGDVVEATLAPVRAAPPAEAGRSAVVPASFADTPASFVHAPASFMERERERIRTHLRRVEAQLRSADPVGLTPRQFHNRLRHLAVLREYAERGEFPRNLDHPGELVPYFVDDRGVHCAVAYLIHRDGRDDLVRRIAENRNNATIAELADDAELVAWLAEAGLTAEDAGRLQPAYCGFQGDVPFPCVPPPPDAADGTISARYGATSMAAAALGGLSTGLTLAGETGSRSRWVGALGTAAGVAGLGLGAYGLAEGGDVRTVGALSAAVGLLSTYVGVRVLLGEPRPGSGRPGDEEADDEGQGAGTSQITVVPIVTFLPEEGRRAGLSVRIRR